MDLRQALQNDSLRSVVHAAFGNGVVRRAALPLVERKIHKAIIETNTDGRPLQVRRDKYDAALAMLHSFTRSAGRGLVSKEVMSRLVETVLDNVLLNEHYKAAAGRLGFRPPLFLLVSPGKRCNLHCKGCYACSGPSSSAKLDWNTFDRILTEKKDLWGSHFTVISGGEPFMWNDDGRGLLDMARKHSSQFFLVFTNGTLITKSVAREIAELGNLTPAISVEGFEEHTDRRRGKGVHRRILQAMEILRGAGVPFGISVTATRETADIVTSDEFLDLYFDREGATYGWIFQYMPIGRKHSLGPMVTPLQRLEMYKRTWRAVRERKIFIADFWNSGTASSGCIAAGRPSGGYLYINWDGAVTPCAFVPYSTHNIFDVFAGGGNLDTILSSPFFQRIRRWQDEYAYTRPAESLGNWLCPCIARDHFGVLLDAVRECGAQPIDAEATDALVDSGYHEGMVKYGSSYCSVSDRIWREHYLSEGAACPQFQEIGGADV